MTGRRSYWVPARPNSSAPGRTPLPDGYRPAAACWPWRFRRTRRAAGADSPVAGVGCGELMIRDPREVPLVTGGAEVMGNGVLAVSESGNVVLCQLAPWQFDYRELYNTKAAFRHLSFALSRMLGNMGVSLETPLLGNVACPAGPEEKRWLGGLYLEEPVVHDDDPYRFFRW